MEAKAFMIWRKLLPFVFIFVLVHFLKDVTQDILKIPTPLDYLGDVKEDLSSFPVIAQNLFMLLGIGSFVAEAFILVAIPVVIRKKEIILLEKVVCIVLIALILFFLVATFLDPRFKIGRL